MQEIKKNQEYIVEIVDQGYQGEGIAKIDNMPVFIQGAIKGERVKILIVKVQTSYAFGKILEIMETSKNRVEEDCETFSKCGGCSLRHISYEETLRIKTEIVRNSLYKELKKEVEVNECIGMKDPIGYRNKLLYPVSINKEGKPVIGIYAQRTHDIIETKKCYIQNTQCEIIAKDIFEFLVENKIEIYNEKTLKGTLRHIVVRIGIKTNEIMCILVLNKDKLAKEKELVEYIVKKYPNIKTIVKNINSENTNVILGNENKTIYGEGYIYDILGEFKFKISPLSFYQVNPIQTEVLYNTAIEYAKLTGEETVFDLYCGVGTIGIFASKKAKKVYGIEIIEDAIKDANENAKINNINNIEFLVSDVGADLVSALIEEKTPDAIFIDPPRKGCDKATIETLLEVLPKKIVYISCNPATLARDINLLQEKYLLEKVQPVDMFPYTHHIETACLLKLK